MKFANQSQSREFRPDPYLASRIRDEFIPVVESIGFFIDRYVRQGLEQAWGDSPDFIDTQGKSAWPVESEVLWKELKPHFRFLPSFEQALTNLQFVYLFHLMEQQLAGLIRGPGGDSSFNFGPHLKLLQAIFDTFQIDVTFMESWGQMNELRLIANTVKHVDASDSRKLRKVRPDLFDHPLPPIAEANRAAPQPVEAALMGEGLYCSRDEFLCKVQGCISFWTEFASILDNSLPPSRGLRDWVFENRSQILAICGKHRARDVRIFGSVARGEAGPDSDIDFLVEIPTDHEQEGWLPTVEILKRELEQLLEHRIDVVATSTPNKTLLQRALRDAVPL